jgi:PKD repeat protein
MKRILPFLFVLVAAGTALAGPKPVITSPTSATGQVGVAFSYQITANNGPIISYSATGLPAGLNVNTSTGLISGTPTTAGTYSVTISATNSSGTGSATLTLTIKPPPPVITSATTASGTVCSAFSYQITATNNPTSYNATPLPAGLTVNTSTGLISGTPTASGTFTVTISATNAGGTGSATLSITISPPPTPVITSATSATGTVGVAFTPYQIVATNCPTSYNAAGLAPGLSVNTSTGVISGTPTAAGTYSVTISATNSGGTGTATLTITINPPPPVITSPTTATGNVGTAFTYQITATNNPTSFNATGLPPGLTVNTSTGVISGTPTTTGTYSVTISATNVSGTGSATLTITIKPAPPVITSSSTASGNTCSAFSYTITATNSPTSYNATPLAAGLTVNTSTGVISGTPTATGTFTVTISATNAGGTGSATLTITISSPPAPVITSAGTATGTVGIAFTYQIVATNCPTSYNAAGLAPGLSINTSTGVISGTPTTAGTYTVTISATNSGGTGSATLTLTINNPVPTTASISPACVTAGSSDFTLTVNGTKFVATSTVNWNGSALTTTFVSSTQLTAIVAAANVAIAGTASITVVNPGPGGGTSNSQTFTISAVPTVSSLSPACAIAGGNGFTLTVNGTNFVSGSTVKWNGASLTTTFNSSTRLTAAVPKANIASPGTASITVVNSGTCGATSNSVTFTITGTPTISSINPSCVGAGGQDFTLTVTGTNFVSTSTVAWNGMALTTTFVSPTQLTATVPSSDIAATGTATITVVNPPPCGATSNPVSLTITTGSPPVINSPLTACGTVGDASFSYTITATNTSNNTTYTAAPLPPGLSLGNGQDKNVISGTPTTAGTTNVTITASTGSGACSTASATLTITINAPASITSALTATATLGTPFSYQITADNSPTSFDATDLPGGLTLGPIPGLISGTPTAAGVFSVTISATSGSTGPCPNTATTTLTLTVNLPGGGVVPPFPGETNVFDTGISTSNPQPSGPLTFPSATTGNYFLSYWYYQNVPRNPNQAIADSANGGLQRPQNLSPGMQYNPYTPGVTQPDPTKNVWRGNPMPPNDNISGQFGDPRASWYITAPWPTNDYVTSSYWGGPNPQIVPLMWPDSGHNFDNANVGKQPTGSGQTPCDIVPCDITSPLPTPTPAPAAKSISILSAGTGTLTSLAELGNIWDPAQLSYTVVNPGGTLPDIPTSATRSSVGAGGHTLAIGRPEFSAFDQNGMRAWQLLDVLTARTSTTNFISTAGLVNINTASRDVLRSLAAGIVLNRDPAILLTGNPPLYSPMDSKVADRFADAVINSRPLLSTSALSAIKDSQGQPFFGNSNQYSSNTNQTAPTEWNDPGREELFAKIYNLATTRSRNFRVFVTGQSLDKNGNVLSTVTKVYQVFIKPTRDPNTGAILSQQVEIKYEGSM